MLQFSQLSENAQVLAVNQYLNNIDLSFSEDLEVIQLLESVEVRLELLGCADIQITLKALYKKRNFSLYCKLDNICISYDFNYFNCHNEEVKQVIFDLDNALTQYFLRETSKDRLTEIFNDCGHLFNCDGERIN